MKKTIPEKQWIKRQRKSKYNRKELEGGWNRKVKDYTREK